MATRRRGILIVLILIGLGVAASVAGLILLTFVGGGATPEVPANATLYLKIQAPFDEMEPSDVVTQFLGETPTLRSTVQAIHKAKVDSRIKALVIEPLSAGSLWGQIQEVRAALDDYRSSGKPLIAFMEYGGAGEYYLASAASKVVLMPGGELDVEGVASYEMFFRGALDKLGVYPDLLHIGDYKTATNTFTEKGFTAAHKEMTASLNRDWYDGLVAGVARGRKMTDEAARQAVDGGPYLGDAAQHAGLVDALEYRDQLDNDPAVHGTEALQAEDYARVPVQTDKPGSGGEIALIYAVGTIASGKSSFDSPAGGVLGSDTFDEWLRKVRVDPDIRAVVVRIDSPGGSAIASEAMWRELMLTRDVKPVVVSMGNVAASGGYYIATPAQTIVADPGTITGSIGVVTGKFVVSGALDKIGVGTASVSDGPFAEIDSPFRPFTDAERARMEEQMHTTYELFLRRVAEGRHEPASKVDAVAQGRVWTGRQAREIGLVDELGGLDDAIRIARDRAKLDPEKGVDLVVYPPRRTFYDFLSNPLGNSVSAGLSLFLRTPETRMIQSAVNSFANFRRGEPLAIMPEVFVR